MHRDWGWAPEYVEAMWRMLQQPVADDFVIATGATHSLLEFVAAAFEAVGLDSDDHVEIDSTLFRPSDLEASVGNAQKAARLLSWRATVLMPETVKRMAMAERETPSRRR